MRELVGISLPLHQLACSGIGQAQPPTTIARRLQLDLSAGHTHQPIAWGSDELTDSVDGHDVRFCNTGGWLLRKGADGRLDYLGAEIVVYETGRGLRSIPIRASDLTAP